MDGQIRTVNLTVDEVLAKGLCWVCGEDLGDRLGFALTPAACLTRTTADPPCHPFCAEWSIHPCAGILATWTTRSFQQVGQTLTVGTAEHIGWWCSGRPATKVEVAGALIHAVDVIRQQVVADGGPAAVERLEADACLLVSRFLPVK